MKLKRLIAMVAASAAVIGGSVAALSQIGVGERAEASDHDDGETDIKARALNLTDHFAFKSPVDATQLTQIMYFNPRALPGRQYFLSSNARYEFHVTKVATKTTPPTAVGTPPKDDFVFRFEASAPTAAGTQFITLTVFKDGAIIGTHIGQSTSFNASRAGLFGPAGAGVPGNSATIDGNAVRYFVGMRADSFFFDVNRFFQVRAFLAQRFFGGAGGIGDATAGLANNCRGDQFLAISAPGVPDLTKEAGGVTDGDVINLFNPPSCAPDFTKNLNVTAIVLNVPKALLGGGDIYDTWSTIAVAQ